MLSVVVEAKLTLSPLLQVSSLKTLLDYSTLLCFVHFLWAFSLYLLYGKVLFLMKDDSINKLRNYRRGRTQPVQIDSITIILKSKYLPYLLYGKVLFIFLHFILIYYIFFLKDKIPISISLFLYEMIHVQKFYRVYVNKNINFQIIIFIKIFNHIIFSRLAIKSIEKKMLVKLENI